jgi:hypothetical protein
MFFSKKTTKRIEIPHEINLDNRTTLARIVTTQTFLEAVVNDIPTGFFKTQTGIHFLITVNEKYLPMVTTEFGMDLLSMEERLYRDIVLGRIEGSIKKGEILVNSWPIVKEPRLATFANHATEKFWKLVDTFREWPSFGDFLRETIGYDPQRNQPHDQFAREYWWLVGPLSSHKSLHHCGIYKGIRVFIYPENGKLPIFTSHLFANMAAHHYSGQIGTLLEPKHIDCLGCYFSGISRECGRDVLKSAILDEQWPIQFYTCGESPDKKDAKHFFLNDSNNSYSLFRCKKDSPGPVWCEEKWDHEGKFFRPSCGLIGW